FESQRELKVFLHSVTHDLRTPVMASSMVLDNLLQQPGEKLTLDRSVLERLYQGSDRAYKMINSVIEAHNTEVNGVIVDLQPCSINELINSALVDLQPVLLEHQATVDNRLDSNLPSIKADPIQLWRVLNNLIGNALKHNPNGVTITIDAEVEPSWLYCTISDDGVGISAEQRDRLFKLYSRGKRSRYMPGLGIGLYLSRQIIMAHGGEIGVVSSLENGSTFWFTLPCQS
ncbi:MAG: HAMP domain-containing sensor histidine kinase, partial [Cyanobacteria bacterium P01_A01_bin.83]